MDGNFIGTVCFVCVPLAYLFASAMLVHVHVHEHDGMYRHMCMHGTCECHMCMHTQALDQIDGIMYCTGVFLESGCVVRVCCSVSTRIPCGMVDAVHTCTKEGTDWGSHCPAWSRCWSWRLGRLGLCTEE